MLLEIDSTVITGAIADIGTAAGPILAAGLGVGVVIWGTLFLFKKGRKAVSS